jgi:hypothetical protein
MADSKPAALSSAALGLAFVVTRFLSAPQDVAAA